MILLALYFLWMFLRLATIKNTDIATVDKVFVIFSLLSYVILGFLISFMLSKYFAL
jgi:hypothetical protein